MLTIGTHTHTHAVSITVAVDGESLSSSPQTAPKTFMTTSPTPEESHSRRHAPALLKWTTFHGNR